MPKQRRRKMETMREVQSYMVIYQVIANTWAWRSKGRETNNQIDEILINNKLQNSILLSTIDTNADCGSNHLQFLCNFKLRLLEFEDGSNCNKTDS